MGTSRFLPAHAVDRPRLRRELDDALGRPLTVIVAGAGSGKSVLLSQWAASHPELPVTWMDIGGRDQDTEHLLPHVLSGLRDTDGAAESVVIFDDLHHATPALEAELTRLIDALPPHAHVNNSSRVDLRQDEHRARLRGDVHELRQAQLAFDREQSAELLRRVTGRDVEESDVSALVERTEGWVTGLLLAAITLRRHPDPAAFVAEFSGSDRLIADYLSEEVLARLDAEERRGLLELSALDRLSHGLVADVSASTAAPQTLSRLERESQFLIPLDDHQEWYRLHHLFRDMLRVRLRAEDPDAEGRIVTAAAVWHARRGDIGTGVEYLLRTNQWEQAADLILSLGSSVLEQGTMGTVIRWITRIPESLRRDDVELLLLHGILAGAVGDAAGSEDLLRTAADHHDATPGEVACALSFLAGLAQWRPRPQSSIDCAVRAMNALAELGEEPTPDILQLTDPDSLTSIALLAGGRAHFLAGNLGDARDWLERALASEGALYSVWRVHTLGSLALLDAWEGQTLRATELAAEALALAETTGNPDHPATADALLAHALVAVERGDAERAERRLHEADVRIAADRRIQLAWVAEAIGAGLAAPHHEFAGARPPGPPPPLAADALAAVRARTRRLRADPAGALQSLADHSGAGTSAVLFEAGSAQVALSRLEEARETQHRLAESPDAGRPLPRARGLLLATSLSAALGRSARTDAFLLEALELAERYGLVAVFLDAGPDITARIAGLGLPSLPGVATQVIRAASAAAKADADAPLADPLTDRELQLLVLLPTRFTNTDLADRYFVSVNTIKSHMAHIYRKLEVSTRRDAVERATELGLITPGN